MGRHRQRNVTSRTTLDRKASLTHTRVVTPGPSHSGSKARPQPRAFDRSSLATDSHPGPGRGGSAGRGRLSPPDSPPGVPTGPRRTPPSPDPGLRSVRPSGVKEEPPESFGVPRPGPAAGGPSTVLPSPVPSAAPAGEAVRPRLLQIVPGPLPSTGPERQTDRVSLGSGSGSGRPVLPARPTSPRGFPDPTALPRGREGPFALAPHPKVLLTV